METAGNNAVGSIVVRVVEPRDLRAITEIYEHHVLNGKASFEEIPPDDDEMRRRQQVLLDGSYPYLVAERDGKLAGYAYAGPYRSRSGYRFMVENSVYVSPACQGGGVGFALLSALIEASEARGYRQMIAVIGDSGNVGSIALHKKCGFRHVRTLDAVGYKFGGWIDSVIMQRALGEGADTLPESRFRGSYG